MSTYTNIIYQIVFGSKNALGFMNEKNKDILFSYIAGVMRQRKSFPYIVGGYYNHLHLISFLHPSENLANLVRDVKRASHNMMEEKGDLFPNFPGWQVGYGAFTYAFSARNNLIRYVQNQEIHHRKTDFVQEFTGLLSEHGIDYDVRYLFI